jgi:hypothetical protein
MQNPRRGSAVQKPHGGINRARPWDDQASTVTPISEAMLPPITFRS